MKPTPLLISCGILGQEIQHLIRRNSWSIECHFLPSSLHFDFDLLEKALVTTLSRFPGRRTIVVYGTCHPGIDRIVEQAGGIRVPCQNCVEMLLGHEEFTRELAEGAYFLLEEWAMHWEEMLERTFGTGPVAREIFRSDRRYLLALQTPCSSDFRKQAGAAAETVGLPLRQRHVSLDHLEKLLLNELARAGFET